MTGESPSPSELTHYGVKGMRWGVRREEDILTSDPAGARYKAAHKPKKTPPLTKGAANLAKNEEKFKAKIDGDNPKEKGRVRKFVSNHKVAVTTGAAITAIVLANALVERRTIASIEELRGKSISPEAFARHVMHSKRQTWVKDDYFKPQSFDREEFTLPAGHTFHRISTKAEDSFKHGTYATHNEADFNRYTAQFRQELGAGELHHVTFQSREEIKVPRLSTVLDTLKDVLRSGNDEHGLPTDDASVLSAYQAMSGGHWSGGRSERLLNALEKRGYGALIDEMDAGVIGESPLVVFARGLLGDKTSTPMSQDDFAHAESNLIELENRKY